ncbi:MAG: homoserine dehydrogenase, partial [Alphaproteobacteria bacterium]
TEAEAVITARAGRPITVTAVAARDRSRARPVPLDRYRWHDDAAALATDPEVDVVVEVIGGSEGTARATVDAALAARKPVVTANKALLALHGSVLLEAAEQAGVPILFEAAVAGGIPVIKALREGLAGNAISRVSGILNGTCNYILTEMRETGAAFAQVLADAQRLGYAEADPSFDVDGVDAAHKLAILAGLAFGCHVDFAGVSVEGIRHISPVDIDFAQELGYRIKLLGMARLGPFGLEQRVAPCMVPVSAPIAQVDGVFNAVAIDGDSVGALFLRGRGAGAGPTASAVVADLIDLARGAGAQPFGVPSSRLTSAPRAPQERHRGSFYIRLMVRDRPGVIADVAAALRDQQVSLQSMLQRARHPEDAVPVVLTTHETEEAAMQRALAAIAAFNHVVEPPRVLRILQDL